MRRAVAVVGGGVAGLATALAFARDGADVTVLEQAERIAEVGAGLQITPNGARALAYLGLEPALDRAGLVARAVVPTDGLTGRPIARFDLTGHVPRYRFVHRADLIDMLYAACVQLGVQVRTGHRFERDAEVSGADLVVGADGIRSVLRSRLNGASDPQFTGQVAWRAVVTADHPPEARIWMAPGCHVVSYALRDGRVNLVAVEERAAWAAEGWHHPDEARNLRTAFAGCAPEVLALLDRVDVTHLWGLFCHPVAPVWQNGRVALAGDAAHPTLPFLAQGANLALEDAVSLAGLVKARGQAPGLAAYEAQRSPRVARAIAAATANARNYHLTGLRRRGAHAALGILGRVAPDAFLRRLDWLYGYDVTRLSD